MVWEVVFLETKPLKHAMFPLNSRDQWCNVLPVRKIKFFLNGVDCFVIRVLWDYPDEDLHVLLTPILFYSFVLYHPTLSLFLLLYPILNNFLYVLQAQLVNRVDFQFIAVLDSVSANSSRPGVANHFSELPQSIPGLEKLINFQGTNGLVGFVEFGVSLSVLEEIVDFLLVGGILVSGEHIHYIEFKL